MGKVKVAIKHVDDKQFKLVDIHATGDEFIRILGGFNIEFMGCALLPKHFQIAYNTDSEEKNALGLVGTLICYKVDSGQIVTMNESDVLNINGVVQVQEMFKNITVS